LKTGAQRVNANPDLHVMTTVQDTAALVRAEKARAPSTTFADRSACYKQLGSVNFTQWRRGSVRAESMIGRRAFIGSLAAAGLAVGGYRPVAAEPPPEITALRVAQFGSLCIAPQYVAEELLRAEGFLQIEYPHTKGDELYKEIAAGRIHLTLSFAGPGIVEIDAGAPLVFLAGVHPGCYEVFGTERIRTMGDFKGKTIVVTA